MIGFLRGSVLLDRSLSGGALLLDVNGVGYEVTVASDQVFSAGTPLELFIHTIVRPDALLLYGFVTIEDREFFETLLGTPGVGPATALAAVRTIGAEALAAAIDAGDVKTVSKIPGVGPKTASRIVLELKGKLVLQPTTEKTTPSSAPSDIEDALRSWGYTAPEIRDALRDVTLPDDEAEALRLALTLLRRS
jgi:Holliday junction DNA helicase RuvA